MVLSWWVRGSQAPVLCEHIDTAGRCCGIVATLSCPCFCKWPQLKLLACKARQGWNGSLSRSRMPFLGWISICSYSQEKSVRPTQFQQSSPLRGQGCVSTVSIEGTFFSLPGLPSSHMSYSRHPIQTQNGMYLIPGYGCMPSEGLERWLSK